MWGEHCVAALFIPSRFILDTMFTIFLLGFAINLRKNIWGEYYTTILFIPHVLCAKDTEPSNCFFFESEAVRSRTCESDSCILQFLNELNLTYQRLTSFVASFYSFQKCWCLGAGFHCVTLISDLFWLSGIRSQSWLWVAWPRDHEVRISPCWCFYAGPHQRPFDQVECFPWVLACIPFNHVGLSPWDAYGQIGFIVVNRFGPIIEFVLAKSNGDLVDVHGLGLYEV